MLVARVVAGCAGGCGIAAAVGYEPVEQRHMQLQAPFSISVPVPDATCPAPPTTKLLET